MWHTLHSYAMLADVTNKSTRLDVGKKFFDRVMYLNCCNAAEGKAPLSYREVEKVMQSELREQCLYEYPRGGMYRESNADTASRGNTATTNSDLAGGSADGYGRGRGSRSRARGGGGGGENRGRGRSDKKYQPEKYGVGYDVARTPAHRQERIGRVPEDKKLARDEGETPDR